MQEPHLSDRLLGSALKLARADNQFRALQSDIESFIKGGAYSFRKYFDSDAAEYVFRGRVVKQPDEGWSVLIGEFLHNVNSALDLLAWQIAARPSEPPPQGTGFPIFPTKAAYRQLWSRQGGHYATRAMPPHAQAIIEDVQPYHRGNAHEGHPLWVLRRLANEDKHQTLHLTGAMVQATRFEVLDQSGVNVAAPKFFKGPFKEGAVIARVPIPKSIRSGEGKAEMKVGFAFDVAFPKPGPANGRPVIRVLYEIRNCVREIGLRLAPFVDWDYPPEPPEEPGPREVALA